MSELNTTLKAHIRFLQHSAFRGLTDPGMFLTVVAGHGSIFASWSQHACPALSSALSPFSPPGRAQAARPQQAPPPLLSGHRHSSSCRPYCGGDATAASTHDMQEARGGGVDSGRSRNCGCFQGCGSGHTALPWATRGEEGQRCPIPKLKADGKRHREATRWGGSSGLVPSRP